MAGTEDGDQLDKALELLRPELRKTTLTGWAGIAGATGLAVAIVASVDWDTDRGMRVGIFSLFGAVLVIGMLARWAKRTHESLVLPALARATGLHYRQDAADFIQSIPRRMLPGGRVRKCEDLIRGEVGGRSISFGEVRIETGGKNSTVQFNGIVAAFPTVVQVPPYFIAAESEVRGWFIFSGNIKVDDLRLIRTQRGMQDTYGIWAAQGSVADTPGFDALVAGLLAVERRIGGEARLYSASSDGRTTYVALRHKRDLFRVGGLFSGRDRLQADVALALRDLTLPLNLVDELLASERRAIAESPQDTAVAPAAGS